MAAAVRGDESLVYVTNQGGSNTVSVINTATNTVVATIPVGIVPGLLAVSPDGTRVYVPNQGSDTVSVINTASNTVVATIPAGSQPVGAGVSPDGARVYVTNTNANTVSVINSATNTVITTIPVGTAPTGVAVTPDGTRAYVTNAFSDNVSVINTATNTVVATIPIAGFIPTPQLVAVSPNGTRAYVTNAFTNNVSVIDTATNTVVATIPAGNQPTGVMVTPDGTRAYVTNFLNNNVSVIDTATNTVVATIPVGLLPSALGICSNGNALLAAGLTFKANTSGALNCTLASGPTGSPGPVFTGGTMQFAGANITSALQISLQAAGGTFDTNGNNATLSGAISGPGTLTKIGAGTLTLAGISTYTGPTNVNAGILSVNGSLASTVFVNSGGTLMGNGSVGGLNVVSGGTAAPGNSIGTLNVAGNVSFGPGSIYQVETNAAGQSDKILAGGTSSLTGGTVQVLAENGNYARQTRYTILTANGGLTGTFANVTSNLAFLTPTLSYDPNDVFLTLNRNDITFSSVAQTPNQRSVAGALDRSPLFSPLVQAVINLTGASALQAFDALSGEVHGSVQSTIVDNSRYFRQAVLGRLRQAPYAGDTGAMAALGSGGPMLAYGASVPATDYSTMAYADARRPNFPIKAPPLAAPAQTADFTYWAQGVGAWGKINNDGNAADVSRNLGGFFTGFDRRFGDWRAGLAGGYTNSSVSVNARASSANIDTGYLAAYAGTNYGPWNVRSGAAFAWNSISTSRSINFPGFAEQATTRYGAGETQVFGELGYGVSFGQIAVEPFAGLAWVHLSANSFTETGGIGALNGSGNRSDVGYSTLGMRAASYYLLQNGMAFIPRASVAWQHAFGTVDPTAALEFVSTGAAFGIAGVPLARDAALVEAGADLQITSQAKIGLSYAGQLAHSIQDHSVKGNFTWRF